MPSISLVSLDVFPLPYLALREAIHSDIKCREILLCSPWQVAFHLFSLVSSVSSLTGTRTSSPILHLLQSSFILFVTLFHRCRSCPVGVSPRLPCAYKSPGGLSVCEDSDSSRAVVPERPHCLGAGGDARAAGLQLLLV